MERLSSASLSEVLDKVAPSIAGGCVNVISVEAIRERSGDRWSRKREQVDVFVERAFTRLASPGSLIVALNDAEFVTIQPDATRWAALNLSAGVLKETLNFFVGAVARADMRLFRVTDFVGGELAVEPVDAARFMAGEDVEPEAPDMVKRGPEAPPSAQLPARARRVTRMVAGPGVELEITVTAEPTWNVGARVVASFLMRTSTALDPPNESRRPGRRRELSPVLAGEVALHALTYAADLIRDEGVQVALHVPLSVNALSYSTSRYRLLHALRDMDPAIRRLIILEVTELSEGVPQSRLAEMVSMLAPYSRAVLARAPSETADLRGWRRCGLSGITLDCAHLSASDRNAQFRLSAFAKAAAEVAPACVGYALESRSLLLAAWAAGFTHLGGPAVSAEVTMPQGAVRLDPTDLYTVCAEAV